MASVLTLDRSRKDKDTQKMEQGLERGGWEPRPAAGRGEDQIQPQGAPEGAQPGQHLDFELLASRTARTNFCHFKAPACGHLSLQP